MPPRVQLDEGLPCARPQRTNMTDRNVQQEVKRLVISGIAAPETGALRQSRESHPLLITPAPRKKESFLLTELVPV
jgi:hypothetical protein